MRNCLQRACRDIHSLQGEKVHLCCELTDGERLLHLCGCFACEWVLREVRGDKIKTKLLWNIWWCHCFFFFYVSVHVSRIASGWTLMKRSIGLIKVHPEARKAALHTLVTTIYVRFIIQTAFGRVCVLIWRMLCGVVAVCVFIHGAAYMKDELEYWIWRQIV